jgi:hypothetical protein
MLDLLLIEWVTKMKPGGNSVEDHTQQSHNWHPVDGDWWVLVHCGPKGVPTTICFTHYGLPNLRVLFYIDFLTCGVLGFRLLGVMFKIWVFKV